MDLFLIFRCRLLGGLPVGLWAILVHNERHCLTVAVEQGSPVFGLVSERLRVDQLLFEMLGEDVKALDAVEMASARSDQLVGNT